MLRKAPVIGVMGSRKEAWTDYASALGQLIAQRGYHLLTGAGPAAMTAVAKAFVETPDRNGVCLGVYPILGSSYKGQALSAEEFPNPYIEVPLVVPLDARSQNDAVPYSRNLLNVMTAHALVFLPGSHGTKNEVSYALMMNKPIMLFGPDAAFATFPQDTLRSDHIKHVEQFFDQVLGVQ
ncbi:MAG: DNA-binding protein [Alphaproteobacteria bacterium]|nr:DNA-binding protein [Alphaproteobacteria bacterium]